MSIDLESNGAILLDASVVGACGVCGVSAALVTLTWTHSLFLITSFPLTYRPDPAKCLLDAPGLALGKSRASHVRKERGAVIVKLRSARDVSVGGSNAPTSMDYLQRSTKIMYFRTFSQ